MHRIFISFGVFCFLFLSGGTAANGEENLSAGEKNFLFLKEWIAEDQKSFEIASNAHFFALEKSLEFSKEVPLSAMESITEFEKDISSKRFVLDSQMAWIELLKVLTRFSEVNLNEYLSSEGDRGSKVDHYLSAGKSLLAAGDRQVLFFNALEEDLTGDIDTFEEEISQQEESFVSRLDAFDAFGVDHALTAMKESHYKRISGEVELMRIQALQKRYKTVLEKMRTILTAVENNKEALKQGITVKYPSGLDIGVIEKE